MFGSIQFSYGYGVEAVFKSFISVICWTWSIYQREAGQTDDVQEGMGPSVCWLLYWSNKSSEEGSEQQINLLAGTDDPLKDFPVCCWAADIPHRDTVHLHSSSMRTPAASPVGWLSQGSLGSRVTAVSSWLLQWCWKSRRDQQCGLEFIKSIV